MTLPLKNAASVVLIALSVAVAGCAGGDTSMYVRNDSPDTWYVKVQRSPTDDLYWVAAVHPRADAFAVSWTGGRDVPVSVLALDCSVVGVFRPNENGEYVVDGIPGLIARVEDHGGPFGSRQTTPGIEDTENCGGFLFR